MKKTLIFLFLLSTILFSPGGAEATSSLPVYSPIQFKQEDFLYQTAAIRYTEQTPPTEPSASVREEGSVTTVISQQSSEQQLSQPLQFSTYQGGSYQRLTRLGRLVSPKLGINVELGHADNLQAVVDADNMAAMYNLGNNTVIGDHRGQSFANLPSSKVGDTMEIIDKDGKKTLIQCIRTGYGASDSKGFYYQNGESKEYVYNNDTIALTTCEGYEGDRFISEWVPVDGSSQKENETVQKANDASRAEWINRRKEALMGDPRFPDLDKYTEPEAINNYINQCYDQYARIIDEVQETLTQEGHDAASDEVFNLKTQEEADAYVESVRQTKEAEQKVEEEQETQKAQEVPQENTEPQPQEIQQEQQVPQPELPLEPAEENIE